MFDIFACKNGIGTLVLCTKAIDFMAIKSHTATPKVQKTQYNTTMLCIVWTRGTESETNERLKQRALYGSERQRAGVQSEAASLFHYCPSIVHSSYIYILPAGESFCFFSEIANFEATTLKFAHNIFEVIQKLFVVSDF